MKQLLILFSFLLFANVLYAQSEKIAIGEYAPDIILANPEGDTITLSSLKGKMVLIDFWASWCVPCVKEQPELKAIYSKHQDKVDGGVFEIYGVSLDRKKENWENNIEKFEINWPQVSDLKFWRSPVAKEYEIEALPFNVIIDEEGKIIAINLHDAELEDFIDEYLK